MVVFFLLMPGVVVVVILHIACGMIMAVIMAVTMCVVMSVVVFMLVSMPVAVVVVMLVRMLMSEAVMLMGMVVPVMVLVLMFVFVWVLSVHIFLPDLHWLFAWSTGRVGTRGYISYMHHCRKVEGSSPSISARSCLCINTAANY